MRSRLALLVLLAGLPQTLLSQQPPPAGEPHQHQAKPDDPSAPSGRMIVPMIREPMIPGLRGVEPKVAWFLPGAGIDPASLPMAEPRQIVDLADGDTLDLEARLVRRTIAGHTFTMYGFNGQLPGPLIRVARNATIHVRFTNRIDLPTTVHWHGVRIDNRSDGVPGVTQDPVAPGGTFWYTVRFPDAGIYWYHPHVREDIQQDLGLYGNVLVRSDRADYDNPVSREEVVMLDDILIDGKDLMPYGRDAANFSLMGRFGNVLLVNGEQRFERTYHAGEVVRFYLTDVSNTRTFNLAFGDAPLKLVGADIGKFEAEMRVGTVPIAPAQRYVVEALFEKPGRYLVTNRIQTVDHMRGRFVAHVDTLGVITVEPGPPDRRAGQAFQTLRRDSVVAREVEPYRSWVDSLPDKELLLTVAVRDLPIQVMQFIAIDTIYRQPVEWSDPMPNMNWLSTTKEVRWILRDVATGRENMDIDWGFKVGQVVKIRLRNDPAAFHPMHHPIHLHGQRFLVLAQDGVPNQNLGWKDTVLVPVGSTVDILLEVSNPGRWMLHCHIAEHLEAGMMTAFAVSP
jgi:FtsP/CotA-like multicopper oxidase with cupredoxin domain